MWLYALPRRPAVHSESIVNKLFPCTSWWSLATSLLLTRHGHFRAKLPDLIHGCALACSVLSPLRLTKRNGPAASVTLSKAVQVGGASDLLCL